MGGSTSSEKLTIEACLKTNNLNAFKARLEECKGWSTGFYQPQRSLLRCPPTNDDLGLLLIHAAARFGSHEIIQLIVERDPVIISTPLHSDKVLVRHVNATPSRSALGAGTPLHFVAQMKSRASVKMLKSLETLLELGACPLIGDEKGKLPSDYIEPDAIAAKKQRETKLKQLIDSKKGSKKEIEALTNPTVMERAKVILAEGEKNYRQFFMDVKKLIVILKTALIRSRANAFVAPGFPAVAVAASAEKSFVSSLEFDVIFETLTQHRHAAVNFHLLLPELRTVAQKSEFASFASEIIHSEMLFSDPNSLPNPLLFIIMRICSSDQVIRICTLLTDKYKLDLNNLDECHNEEYPYPMTPLQMICDEHVFKFKSVKLLRWFVDKYKDTPLKRGHTINIFTATAKAQELRPMLCLIKNCDIDGTKSEVGKSPRFLSEEALLRIEQNEEYECQVIAAVSIALLLNAGDSTLAGMKSTAEISRDRYSFWTPWTPGKTESVLIRCIRYSKAYIVRFLLETGDLEKDITDDTSARERFGGDDDSLRFQLRIRKEIREQIPGFSYEKFRSSLLISECASSSLINKENADGDCPLVVSLRKFSELDASFRAWSKEEEWKAGEEFARAARSATRLVTIEFAQQTAILEVLFRTKKLNIESLLAAEKVVESLMAVKDRGESLKPWLVKIENLIAKAGYRKAGDGKYYHARFSRDDDYAAADPDIELPSSSDKEEIDSSLVRAVERAAKMKKEAEEAEKHRTIDMERFLIEARAEFDRERGGGNGNQKKNEDERNSVVVLPSAIAFGGAAAVSGGGGMGESDISL